LNFVFDLWVLLSFPIRSISRNAIKEYLTDGIVSGPWRILEQLAAFLVGPLPVVFLLPEILALSPGDASENKKYQRLIEYSHRCRCLQHDLATRTIVKRSGSSPVAEDPAFVFSRSRKEFK
jgi:hypothetical protein